ncbi:MAG TPA: hypothetical protein VNN22_02710 [Verrucomicrobiae bacterium]|nr:hypothetical protein [Verrucomicrobiae bacterium]
MEFRRFLKRVLIFASPLVVWVVVVITVDPFDYFNWSHAFSEQVKKDNAATLNSILFNMLKEVNHPCENLIIGDSRAEDLPVEQISQITGERYFILGANALKLNESIDLFYFANRIKPLKRAVFTLNFNEFNEYAFADRVTSVEAMIHNPLLYVFDTSVAQAGYYVVKSSATKRQAVSSVPPMSEDEWWNYIVSVRGREHYERFRYPAALYQRMQKMVAFAKAQETEITFIIVPNHADFQKRVREFGLDDQYLEFKRDLCRLDVRVVDYDFVNDITTNRSDFRDPLHSNEKIGLLIANEVFHGPLVKGKLLDAAWADQCSKFLF